MPLCILVEFHFWNTSTRAQEKSQPTLFYCPRSPLQSWIVRNVPKTAFLVEKFARLDCQIKFGALIV